MPTTHNSPAPALLKTSTLIDIGRYGDKVFKTARLSSVLKYGLVQNKINMLDAHSDPIETLLAFEEDLAATAKDVKSLGVVVDSLNDDHVAPELKGVTDSFMTLFGDDYDPNTFTLSMYGVGIRRGANIGQMDLESLKASVYVAAVGQDVAKAFPYDDYKTHLRNVRYVDRHKPVGGSTLAELIAYSYKRSSIPDWNPFTNQVKSMADRNAKVRASLGVKARKVLDRKVLGVSNAMVDGVAKSSTYITKAGGRDQVSNNHKKHESVLAKIEQLVKDIPCIRAVEIDQDSNIVKFHDLLIDIKEMNFDVPDSFELKSRKLGNYRACGLSYVLTDTETGEFMIMPEAGFSNNDLRIVAMGVHTPTSVAHELAHFRDLDETDPVRNKLVKHFLNKVDRDQLNTLLNGSAHYLSYYLNDREVVARLGEIGFLLNKYDYQENESLAAFSVRVLDAEPISHAEKLQFEVALAKPLSVYMGDNPLSEEIYFHLSEWQPAELTMVKDFVHGMFFKPRPEVQARLKERIEAGELDGLSKNYHEARKDRKKRIVGPQSDTLSVQRQFGRLPAASLAKTYLVGVEESLFKDGEFAEGLAMSVDRLGRGGATNIKSLDTFDDDGVAATFNGIAEWLSVIDPLERPGDAIIGKELLTELMLKYALLPEERAVNLPNNMEQFHFNSFFDSMSNTIPASLWERGRDLDSRLLIKTYSLTEHGLEVLTKSGAGENLKQAYARYENVVIDPPDHQLAAASDTVKLHVIKSRAFDAFSRLAGMPSESAHDFAWTMEQVELREAWGSEAKGPTPFRPFMEGPLPKLMGVSDVWGALTNHETTIVSALCQDNVLGDIGVSEAQLTQGVAETVARYRELLPAHAAMRFSASTTSFEQLMTATENWFAGRDDRGGWLKEEEKISDLLMEHEDRREEFDRNYRRVGVGPSPLLTLLTVADQALVNDEDRASKMASLCLRVSDAIKAHPGAFRDVHEALTSGVDEYKKSVSNIHNAGLACHPWVRSLADASIESDIANLDAPYKPSDALLHGSVAATVVTIFDAAVSKTPVCVVSGGIGNAYVYAGDKTRDEMAAFALYALHTDYALSSTGLPKQVANEVYGHAAAQPDIEKARTSIDQFIASASAVDLDMTKQVLQAFAAMPMINFPGRFTTSTDWMDSQLRTFEHAAQWVNLPLAEDKVRYVGLDDWVDTRLSYLRERAPELVVAPELAVDLGDDEPEPALPTIEHVTTADEVEPYNMVEINQAVPPAEDGQLRPEHQMRMF